MCEQTWTIVQFEEDCSLEAVPSTWIEGQFCHWPTYSQDKLMTAIRKHESLNTCWPSYKIRSFRNSTFNDYSKARSKARTAEFTSDLNSEIEDNAKRKRIQKILSSSSSEDSLETSLLSQPPRLKQTTRIKQKNLEKSSKSVYDSPNQSTYQSSFNTENNNSILGKDVDSLSYETALVSLPCNSACSCCSKREKLDGNIICKDYTQIHTYVTSRFREAVTDNSVGIRGS